MTLKPLAVISVCCALFIGIARAATPPPACASLCGDWLLDAGTSDSPTQRLDAAFLQFSEPKARRHSIPNTDNLDALGKAAAEEALGPILSRPRSRELREEIANALRQPRLLNVSGRGEDIHFSGDGASSMRITPGERSARVDRYGTARIESRWRGSQLAVSERYDRRNQQETTYSMERDGSLRMTQVMTRQGLPRITVRSVYRRP